ncbi:hypothetical protein [Amaricoccus sp. W119]|uniref:hypothetical protein n=1 Tax=Amaricoccus sp. W119 TaxID=3391833 RepID=UPI0039A5F12E
MFALQHATRLRQFHGSRVTVSSIFVTKRPTGIGLDKSLLYQIDTQTQAIFGIGGHRLSRPPRGLLL